jgi:hypothetical protein
MERSVHKCALLYIPIFIIIHSECEIVVLTCSYKVFVFV